MGIGNYRVMNLKCLFVMKRPVYSQQLCSVSCPLLKFIVLLWRELDAFVLMKM